MTRRLIVFAKAPRAGRVKTRLAAAIGEDGALAVHRRLLLRTVAVAAAIEPLAVTLAVDGEDDGTLAGLAATRHWTIRAQRGADLGARMDAAFADAFATGADRVVLVGSDCPVLRPDDLLRSFAALERHDAVFVPAEDGGYVLVGLVRPLSAIFDGVAWSRSDVMAVTRERLHAGSIAFAELRTVWDVDRPEDVHRWQAWIDAGHDVMIRPGTPVTGAHEGRAA